MKNKNFLLLLAGQLVSQVGDKFHMIALSFWVLETTGSSAKMGMVLAASLIPSLILGLFSGAIIDRYNRKNIIVVTDLIRGIALLLFAIFFFYGNQSFALIIIIQIILSINAAFFDPAIPSIIPQIVRKKELASANSKHQFVNGFSTIFGAFFAGICISGFGYVSIFFINAGSFLFSAFFETFIQIPKASYKSVKEEKPTLLKEISEGYKYIFSKTNLVILLMLVMLIHFFVGSNEVLMPIIANASLEDGAKTLGFFQSAFGAGVVLMAAFLSVFKKTDYEKNLLFLSVSVIGVIFLILSFLVLDDPIPLFFCIPIFFIFGVCIISAYVSFKTLIQKSIENQFSGRVFAVAGTIGNGSIPAAMIVYGFLFEKFRMHEILILSGGLLIILSAMSYIAYNKKLPVLSKSIKNAFSKN